MNYFNLLFSFKLNQSAFGNRNIECLFLLFSLQLSLSLLGFSGGNLRKRSENDGHWQLGEQARAASLGAGNVEPAQGRPASFGAIQGEGGGGALESTRRHRSFERVPSLWVISSRRCLIVIYKLTLVKFEIDSRCTVSFLYLWTFILLLPLQDSI